MGTPNSGTGTARLLDNLVWILQAGDFSRREFVDARYSHNTKTAANKFLHVMHEKGWIRKAYKPKGTANMHDFTLWCANKNNDDVNMAISIVRHGTRGHAMSPISGRRTDYSEEGEEED